MSKYLNFRYIFPPRPKRPIPPTELEYFDDGTFLAQPKLNGSNCLIFTNGIKSVVMNRHNGRLTNFNLTELEIREIYRGTGGWTVLNGEYLNKNKDDETGLPFNHKFVIFDILCFDGNYLLGSTFEQRVKILDELYGKLDSDKSYLWKVSENVFRVKSYESEFLQLYNKLTPIDMIEGLVLKRKSGKLEAGTSENNNIRSQIKCRKKCNSYRY